MLARSSMYVVPALLASMMLVAGCGKKVPAESVVLEEDIILDDGTVLQEWVVEDIEPVPQRKAPATAADARPSKEHIWVPGEWKRDKDRWMWESGRWAKPPHKQASWMKGHWREQAGKWHWTPGHWVVLDRPLRVTETIVTPEPMAETKPPMPSDKNHWVAGYWDWDGNWYWIPGYWTSKPHPQAEWVPGHWDEFGLHGEYRWIGGHWRVKG